MQFNRVVHVKAGSMAKVMEIGPKFIACAKKIFCGRAVVRICDVRINRNDLKYYLTDNKQDVWTVFSICTGRCNGTGTSVLLHGVQ